MSRKSRHRRRKPALGTPNPLVLLALVLTVLTWWSADTDFRTETVHGVVPYFDFPGPRAHWSANADVGAIGFEPETVVLRPNAPGPLVLRRVEPLLDRHAGGRWTRLVLAGRIDRPGPPIEILDEASRPRIGVRYHGDTGPLDWGAVAKSTGREASTSFVRVLEPPSGTTALEITLSTRGPTEWRFSEVSLVATTLTTPYLGTVALLVAGWIWFAIRLFRPLAASTGGSLGATALFGLLSVLIVGTGLSQPLFAQSLSPIVDMLAVLLPNQSRLSGSEVQKLGHVAAFCLLTIVMIALRRRLELGWPSLLALLLMLALATESLQLHVYNRTATVSDVLIDLWGVAIGAALAALFTLMMQQGRPGRRFVDARRRRRRRRRAGARSDSRRRTATPD